MLNLVKGIVKFMSRRPSTQLKTLFKAGKWYAAVTLILWASGINRHHPVI
jgi:hypothetical protein